MKLKWDGVLTAALVVCALTTTGLVVHREFFTRSAGPASQPQQKPVFIKDWKSVLEQGVLLGPSNAAIQLIEFSDFECPSCASFHKTLKTLRERFPAQVSLTYVHFPLPMHRFAQPAARVAECAGEQGRFESMHDQLFEQQASLGLKPWSDYAKEAAVPDLPAFEVCIKSTAPMPRVEAGQKLAAKLDVQGTPTIVINGWLLPQPPATEELDRMVKAVLAGKSPVSADQNE
jgi:protein-disulfide isomerase